MGRFLAERGWTPPSGLTSSPTVLALVQNPIFTAMIIAQVGTALMAPTWLALAGLVLLIAGIELQVRRLEEPSTPPVPAGSNRGWAAWGRRLTASRRDHPGRSRDDGRSLSRRRTSVTW